MRFEADVGQLMNLSDVMNTAKTTAKRWLREAVENEFIPAIDRSILRMKRSQKAGWSKRGDGRKLGGSFRVRRISQTGTVTVGSDVVYAGLHQYSPGYHFAESGKKMAIPLPGVNISYKSLQALRAMRMTMVGKWQGKGRPKKRDDIIYMKEGNRWIPIYLLRRTVKMPLPFLGGKEGYVSHAWRLAQPKMRAHLEERWLAWMQRRYTP